MTVIGTKGDFAPETYVLMAETELFRVTSGQARRAVTEFNPGIGSPTRFGFFMDGQQCIVPVLYAATSEIGALSESLLHDIPVEGGFLPTAQYEKHIMAKILPTRDLTLASFMGTGLRRIRAAQNEITSTGPEAYPNTVFWAKAAHETGLDGVIWISQRCNTERAVVLFGDRVAQNDLRQDASFARVFGSPADRDWLTDICAPLHIQVLED